MPSPRAGYIPAVLEAEVDSRRTEGVLRGSASEQVHAKPRENGFCR
jgi:hypothetical protein